MQLTALEGKKIILAKDATRQKNYLCPECLSVVRLRKGRLRKAHFYHIKKNSCHQSKKTIYHLQVQSYFLDNFPLPAHLEHPFPKIKRIADVYIPAMKMVFEVQCSPISLREARQRNRDYAKLGITPIWILHDRRFNKKHLTHAEAFLRKHLCYFTNFDKEGKGIFYDQIEWIWKSKRLWKRPLFSLSLTMLKKKKKTELALSIIKLRRFSPYYFPGDASERLFAKEVFPSFFRKNLQLWTQEVYRLTKEQYNKCLIYLLRRNAK